MSRLNRIFPAWKKTKKGDRMPGSHPARNRNMGKIVFASDYYVPLPPIIPTQDSGKPGAAKRRKPRKTPAKALT